MLKVISTSPVFQTGAAHTTRVVCEALEKGGRYRRFTVFLQTVNTSGGSCQVERAATRYTEVGYHGNENSAISIAHQTFNAEVKRLTGEYPLASPDATARHEGVTG